MFPCIKILHCAPKRVCGEMGRITHVRLLNAHLGESERFAGKWAGGGSRHRVARGANKQSRSPGPAPAISARRVALEHMRFECVAGSPEPPA